MKRKKTAERVSDRRQAVKLPVTPPTVTVPVPDGVTLPPWQMKFSAMRFLTMARAVAGGSVALPDPGLAAVLFSAVALETNVNQLLALADLGIEFWLGREIEAIRSGLKARAEDVRFTAWEKIRLIADATGQPTDILGKPPLQDVSYVIAARHHIAHYGGETFTLESLDEDLPEYSQDELMLVICRAAKVNRPSAAAKTELVEVLAGLNVGRWACTCVHDALIRLADLLPATVPPHFMVNNYQSHRNLITW